MSKENNNEKIDTRLTNFCEKNSRKNSISTLYSVLL